MASQPTTKAATERTMERLFAQMKALQAACPLMQVGVLAVALGLLLNDDANDMQAGIVRLLVLGRLEPDLRPMTDSIVSSYLDTIASSARENITAK